MPVWVFPRNSPPWESMGKVLVVLLGIQLRLMPPSCVGWMHLSGATTASGKLLLY